MVKKIFLANGVSELFINGKPAVINGLNFKDLLPWLVAFLVVPFHKIPRFSIDFLMAFISLSVRVIPAPTFF